MATFDNIDLIVRDVPAATAFFEDIVGLTVRYADENFAELESGAVTIMLSPAAMTPMGFASGVILHFQVEDVRATWRRAVDLGVDVLMEPAITDWGTESVMIAGPEGVVIDFYRWVSPHRGA